MSVQIIKDDEIPGQGHYRGESERRGTQLDAGWDSAVQRDFRFIYLLIYFFKSRKSCKKRKRRITECRKKKTRKERGVSDTETVGGARK